jgi:hypothetical protein
MRIRDSRYFGSKLVFPKKKVLHCFYASRRDCRNQSKNWFKLLACEMWFETKWIRTWMVITQASTFQWRNNYQKWVATLASVIKLYNLSPIKLFCTWFCYYSYYSLVKCLASDWASGIRFPYRADILLFASTVSRPFVGPTEPHSYPMGVKKNVAGVCILCILICRLLDTRREDHRFWSYFIAVNTVKTLTPSVSCMSRVQSTFDISCVIDVLG